ncbi:MAG: hypothetical protein IPO81_08090 [Kouleothrix sp.]|mgnify:CR=1 FL=1|nr:hypothetical protein [Kouleothrix sp.]
MADELTLARFVQYLNDQFRVDAGGATELPLDLVEAAEVRAVQGWEAFSLVFRGPADAFLPQSSYRFRHDGLGDFDLFFTPIRQDQHGFYYEAVFNRQLRQEQL